MNALRCYLQETDSPRLHRSGPRSGPEGLSWSRFIPLAEINGTSDSSQRCPERHKSSCCAILRKMAITSTFSTCGFAVRTLLWRGLPIV